MTARSFLVITLVFGPVAFASPTNKSLSGPRQLGCAQALEAKVGATQTKLVFRTDPDLQARGLLPDLAQFILLAGPLADGARQMMIYPIERQPLRTLASSTTVLRENEIRNFDLSEDEYAKIFADRHALGTVRLNFRARPTTIAAQKRILVPGDVLESGDNYLVLIDEVPAGEQTGHEFSALDFASLEPGAVSQTLRRLTLPANGQNLLDGTPFGQDLRLAGAVTVQVQLTIGPRRRQVSGKLDTIYPLGKGAGVRDDLRIEISNFERYP